MAKNMSSGCKSCPKRYISPGVQNHDHCRDVCVNPICGDPDMLTMLAPVVYDELGINLCRTMDISPPSGAVTSVSAQILDIDFVSAPDATTTVSQINGRPNCYLVTLTNLCVTFLLTFYDCTNRSIGTQTVRATYLPTNGSVADYDYLDDDTNPALVELEIFAPYGVSYTASESYAPVIQYIGFTCKNNTIHQGLNLIAIPKILSFDSSSDAITIGLTLYVKSIYYSQYLIPHQGKAVVPKASIQPNDDTICMDFVCGDLLELSIKPLELGPPKCESSLKQSCETPCDCCTQTSASISGSVPAAPQNSCTGFCEAEES